MYITIYVLIRTLDCGYRYQYVLGYDKGDLFYDSKEVEYSMPIRFCITLNVTINM